jgi:hypothetical protein
VVKGAVSVTCTALACGSRTIAAHPGTPARGHFAGTPTRSRHARGAVEPGHTFRMAEVGAGGPFRRPSSVAVTAGGRMGVGGGRKHP